MDSAMKNLVKLLMTALICLSGCVQQRIYKSPSYAYYLNPAKDLRDIGRVALLEMTSYPVVPDLPMAVTESLYEEIQKKQIFSLITIQQDDPEWRHLQLSSDKKYSFEELNQIRNQLKCDAFLVGTITHFEPYPHMAVGLRLRLIDLSDGGLFWAMEQVWDTSDKNTLERIEAYYNPSDIILNEENLSGRLGSVSTLKFLKFVSYEIASTMQN